MMKHWHDHRRFSSAKSNFRMLDVSAHMTVRTDVLTAFGSRTPRHPLTLDDWQYFPAVFRLWSVAGFQPGCCVLPVWQSLWQPRFYHHKTSALFRRVPGTCLGILRCPAVFWPLPPGFPLHCIPLLSRGPLRPLQRFFHAMLSVLCLRKRCEARRCRNFAWRRTTAAKHGKIF